MPEGSEGLDPGQGTTPPVSPEGTPPAAGELPTEPKGTSEPKAPESKGEPKATDTDFSFEALEEKAPSAFRKEIKKAHAYVTKKNQEAAKEREEYKQKVSELEKNQLTDEIKTNYPHLLKFYQDLRAKPEERLKDLVNELNIKPESLFTSPEPEVAPELALDQVVTREDYANWTKQEIRKAREADAKEIENLKTGFKSIFEAAEKSKLDNFAHQKVSEAAEMLPGFLETENGKPKLDANGKYLLSKDALEAIDQVRKGLFLGPDGIRNAWATIRSGQATKEIDAAKKEAAEAKKQLAELEKNLRGVNPPPKTPSADNSTRPVTSGKPRKFWEELRKEPLLPT